MRQNSKGFLPFAICTWQRIWHQACFCGCGQMTEAFPPAARTKKEWIATVSTSLFARVLSLAQVSSMSVTENRTPLPLHRVQFFILIAE